MSIGNDRGTYHPGIQTLVDVHYWPNRTFPTRKEARTAAQAAIDDALATANAVVEQWNLTEL